ncbi:winged helix-turn-helix domain-containing protein [Rhizobium sp. SYY.PMSO]|uniref:winged helix-turn-helix domain-containing protein n=1 Tax=Rhizobium sp. SYY.PMSO TaxID=3382192 RepID=UPI00398FE46B
MSKSDALFVTDAQCAERIGISTEEFKAIVPELTRQGFPVPDPLFGKRRYWPAVRVFLDRRYGMGKDDSMLRAPPGLDEEEPWKKKKK